ncbi:MAG: HAMP domain-containing histidine kinase [Culturomica sp.]|nr:HAMP domain-containing histidine kinase [Culturomica sp.]
MIVIEFCILVSSGIYLYQLYLSRRDAFANVVNKRITFCVYNLSARYQEGARTAAKVDIGDEYLYSTLPGADDDTDTELLSLYDTRDTSRWKLRRLDRLVQNRPYWFQQRYDIDTLPIHYKIVDAQNNTLAELKSGVLFQVLTTVQEEIELGITSGHTLQIRYNYPLAIFFRNSSKSLLYVGVVLTLLMIGTVILYRLLQLERKKSWYHRQFTYGIIHDLKSPVNNVMKALYLYEHDDSSSACPREEYMQRVREELAMLDNNVSRLLNLFVNVQGVRLDKVPVDVVRLLHEAADYYSRERIEDKNVRFSFHSSTASLLIYADAGSLFSVFLNLIDNAIKYSDHDVHVEFFCTERKRRVEIIVRDNGWGMSPEAKDHVFKSTYRGKHNRQVKGYGLGLQNVYLVVKAHRGTIHYESKQGKGTDFTLQFPRI